MPQTLGGVDSGRLERSCSLHTDSIRFGPGAPGLERAEVHLSTCAYAPHRHDTYGIGIATAGVLVFRYRGSRRICLPGQLHILHPDERHDGGAGTGDGLAYRIVYVEPRLVSDALAGRALPFVAEPVQDVTPMAQPVVALLTDFDEPVSELGEVDIATAVADWLVSLSGCPAVRRATIDTRAVELVRDYLTAHAREQTRAAFLEEIAGIDRFTIARHFRRAFGTSPDRYRRQHRLALARAAIERGQPLAQAAADAGFADQSHLTRHFKRAYGLTPGRWAALVAASGPPIIRTTADAGR